MARKFDRAEAALAKARKLFRDRSQQQNYEFIRKLESGAPQGDAGLDAIAKQLREVLDGRRDDVRALGKGKLQSFYENYFPHIWKRRQNDELIWASFFGRRHIGAVRSAALPFSLLLGAIAPLAVSYYFDRVGNYDGALVTVAILNVLSSFMILAVPKPTRA